MSIVRTYSKKPDGPNNKQKKEMKENTRAEQKKVSLPSCAATSLLLDDSTKTTILSSGRTKLDSLLFFCLPNSGLEDNKT
jgi:hypothetical protein